MITASFLAAGPARDAVRAEVLRVLAWPWVRVALRPSPSSRAVVLGVAFLEALKVGDQIGARFLDVRFNRALSALGGHRP